MDSTTTVTPTCPECGAHEIAEMASTRVEYPVARIAGGAAETEAGRTGADGEFDGFECRACLHESDEIADFVAPDPDFEPSYEWSRHGGSLLLGVRLGNGGLVCVSRNYTDRRWRIFDDPRHGDHTYGCRDEAARAASALTRAGAIA